MQFLNAMLCVLVFTGSAEAAPSLTVSVTTPKGDPIPHATVSFEDEGYQRHKVNRQNGDLSLQQFSTSEGNKDLEPGGDVRFTATAAGYYPSQQSVTLSTGNRTTMRVTLRSVDLSLTDEPVQFSLSPTHVLGLSPSAQNSFENTVHAARWMIQQGSTYRREAMQWSDLAIKRSDQAEPAPHPKDRSVALRLATIAALSAWHDATLAGKTSPSDIRQTDNFQTLAFRAAKRWLDYNIATSQDFSEPRNLCISTAIKPPDCDK